MTTYLIQNTTLSSLADAIRNKTGKSESFTPAQMISEINNLSLNNNEREKEIVACTISNYINSDISKVGSYAFYNYSALTSVNLPNCSYVGSYAFCACLALTSINLPNCLYVGRSAFYGCSALTSVIILTSSVPVLQNSGVFYYTPLENSFYLGYYGSIYVKSSLLTSFKNATNWSYFSNRFVGI